MRNAILVAVLAVSGAAHAESINGRLADVYTDFPVVGADVFVSGPHGLQATVQTDEHGHYLAAVDGPGTYFVTFANGAYRKGFKVEVAGPGSTHFDAKIEQSEVIEIHDLPKKLPPVMPKLARRLPPIPEYSDYLIEHDRWAKAWMLLDIDEQGNVARTKFLNRPGYDLDQIAIDHALALKFSPAQDEYGRPTKMLIIYPIEWPSYWWMRAVGGGLVTRMPEASQIVHVPCRGSGPLRLESVHPVYRDCTRPNLARANLEKEPWFQINPGTATH